MEEKKESKAKQILSSLKADYNKALSQFKRQKQPAWRPYFTVWTVVPTFLIFSVSILILGGGFLYVDSEVRRFSVDYTDCQPLFGTRSCSQLLNSWRRRQRVLPSNELPPKCVCWFRFRLRDNFEKDVFLYYSLFNFYQNHRRYAQSADWNQWKGQLSASSDCDPMRYKQVQAEEIDSNSNNSVSDEHVPGGDSSPAKTRKIDRPIVPCGVIANSFFNDTFDFWYKRPGMAAISVPLARTKLTWRNDYQRGRDAQGAEKTFQNFTNPPYWGNTTVWDLNPGDPYNNGLRYEPLIVWMRVAAFPDFMKLYARVDHKLLTENGKVFTSGMPAGDYFLRISYNYPVTDFHGRKSVVLTNTNKVLGNSYEFLGIVYLIVGIILGLSGFALLILHYEYGVSREESFHISHKTPYFFNKNGLEKSLIRH